MVGARGIARDTSFLIIKQQLIGYQLNNYSLFDIPFHKKTMRYQTQQAPNQMFISALTWFTQL
jgi:hypothetical protein